jgi:hypothetical protein
MKKIIYLLGLLLPLTLSGQIGDQSHLKQIDEHLISKLSIEKNPIESPVLNKVFAGSFYRIGIFFVYEEENSVSSYGCHDCYINITDGNLTEFQQLSSDQELKELFSFLRSDFHLKNETDAAAFEAALNVLYPVDKEEQGNVKHINKASQWIFIRGKFFDDDTAVIVTTDPSGVVSRIELKLSYTAEV